MQVAKAVERRALSGGTFSQSSARFTESLVLKEC